MTATIPELEAALAALHAQDATLAAELLAAQERVGLTRDRIQGVRYAIHDADEALATARRIEADAPLPRAVKIGGGVMTGFNQRDLVISRVTPARVYVREVGSERETYYDRSGRSNSWARPEMDVPATIAAWNTYQSSPPPRASQTSPVVGEDGVNGHPCSPESGAGSTRNGEPAGCGHPAGHPGGSR